VFAEAGSMGSEKEMVMDWAVLLSHAETNRGGVESATIRSVALELVTEPVGFDTTTLKRLLW
jgi:hypothetical protein